MRSVTGAFNTEIGSAALRAVLFLELNFDTGTQRYTNAPITIQWNGFDWIGLANVGSLSSSREGLSGEVHGIVAELSGIPSSVVAEVFTEHVQGRPATLYFSVLDANWQVVADPVVEFRGLCDRLALVDNGETSTVQLTIESRLIDFKRPRIFRWNTVDHLSRMTADRQNDTFFNHVENMVDKTFVWPTKDYFKR